MFGWGIFQIINDTNNSVTVFITLNTDLGKIVVNLHFMFFHQAADEPAYLTVGTDVSAKYRGAFCEAKIKTVKRLVKVKVIFVFLFM